MTDLLPLLQEFYRDKLSQTLRHLAGSRLVTQYDINNTYQYIINRDEAQLSWVGRAIVELGGDAPDSGREPPRTGAMQTILEEDLREAENFVERWRPRSDAMANARHRGMLRVILGEVLEQKRFFEQALAGRLDLLGRRTEEVGERVGTVLPTRWVE